MRNALLTFVVAALVATTLFASSAFNSASTGERGISIRVRADDVAYLQIRANGASPHKCHVSGETTGALTVSFQSNSGCPNGGGGIGINPSTSTYYFHDLINLTSLGTSPTLLYINSTPSTGAWVKVCVDDRVASMTTSCYGNSMNAEGAPGKLWYVGVAVYSSNTGAGNAVSGTITIEAAPLET